MATTQTWLVNGSVVDALAGRRALRIVKASATYSTESDASGVYHMSDNTVVQISNRK